MRIIALNHCEVVIIEVVITESDIYNIRESERRHFGASDKQRETGGVVTRTSIVG